MVTKLFIKLLNLSPKSFNGPGGLRLLGHRNYVGGSWLWEKIGRLQLNFLMSSGLKPSDCLLDIGCGSLRAGRYFIEYLDAANYLGIEKHRELLEAGIVRELRPGAMQEKSPEFVISSAFDFHRFSRKPAYSIAQSVFTHLIDVEIVTCLDRLRAFVVTGHEFYATFFEGEATSNPLHSHDIWCFQYSPKQMEGFGESTGWKSEFLGSWGHPRNQLMVRYVAA